MDGIHFAVTPIANKKRFLILRRKLGTVAKGYSCGGTWPDIYDCGKAVCIVNRPFPRTISPAKLGPASDMANSCRAIPRSVEIPFHISIVSK